MTEQLSLFPDSSLNMLKAMQDDKITVLETALNPVDEVFAATSRFRNSRDLIELLHFIARFPKYSAFNGWLLYTQNSSATYVATARTWAQKFGRYPKFDSRPLLILAPMAPILFVFDIQDTEGARIPSILPKPDETRNEPLGKIYALTLHNCTIQGIAVYETTLNDDTTDTANRITPALRKKYSHLNLKKDTGYLILIDKTQNLENRYASLVHELGHIFCSHLGIDRHAWWPERGASNINSEEIEADSVAYLVCRRIGLQVISEKYLSNYLKKKREIPLFSLNAVLQAVNYVEDMGKYRWKKPKKKPRRD